MSFLSAERRSRLRVLLTNLVEGQREHEEIGVLDAQIRLDYHGRFLIELLQNAVDPALAAGIQDASLLVVRTPALLAVLNQGAPFDEAGLKSIISLGLSAKRPDEAIGNKGVGFKSVFEVADLVEVFGAGDAGGSLARPPKMRLGLGIGPASSHEDLVDEAMEVAEEAGMMNRLAERFTDVRAGIGQALGRAAGWRFPSEPAPKVWTRCWRALGLKRSDIALYQTVVVLHLRSGAESRVDRAIQDLTAGGAEVVLFLPGVRRLEIREPKGTLALQRENLAEDRHHGVSLRCIAVVGSGCERMERDYWVKAATLDGQELEQAARALPGDGWASVTRAEVQVALPVPVEGEPLEPDGRYFIGFPSKDATGSPFRVDARFHGTISRTSLDLRDNAYNVLIERAAATAAADLVRLLRDAPADATFLRDALLARRAVTLGLASSQAGHFAGALRAQLHGEPVVFLEGWEGFALPRETRRIPKEDEPLVTLAQRYLAMEGLRRYNLRLVEAAIAGRADDLLTDLGVPAMRPTDALQRVDGTSLAEALAKALPRTDVESWRALLRWLAAHAGPAAQDQRVLPTGGDRLVRPSSMPFVPLLDQPAPGDVARDDIPAHLVEGLAILDASILDGDEDLRRILVEGWSPLARRPAAFDLIGKAILPALAERAGQGDQHQSLELLVLCLRLLAKVAPSTNVADLDWLVPCGQGWRPAGEVYLGDAWAEEDRKKGDPPGLVEELFSADGLCLVPWWGGADRREGMRAALVRIGVADTPRIVVFDPIQRVFWGDYRQAQDRGVAAPAPIPAQVWHAWLAEIARTAAVDWGPRTWWGLGGVEWIDGLEQPEQAARLAGWALAQRYNSARLVSESRGKPGAALTQPWVFALRQMTEPVVPSHPRSVLEGQLAHPADLCRLPRGTSVPWLPRVADGLNDETLTLVGVRTLQEMPGGWLLDQITIFASTLEGGRRESQIARELWGLLASRAESEVLPDLTAALLPLWRDGVVVPVRGSDVATLCVVDDPYGAEILGDLLEGSLLLEPEGKDWTALVTSLRASLPAARIELVSDLEVPWRLDEALETPSLPATIATRAGDRVVAVIAALLHRSGIDSKEMRRRWSSFVEAGVQLGVLPESAPRAVWIEWEAVLLCQDLQGPDLVSEVWPVLGSRWRDELLALGWALKRGERGVREFLRHEAIPEAAIEAAAMHFGLAGLLPSWSDAAREVPPPFSGVGRLVSFQRPARVHSGNDDDFRWKEGVFGPIELDAITARVRTAPMPNALPPRVATAGPGRVSIQRSGGGAGAGGGRSLPGAPHPAGDERFARQIGHLGEVFAFRALKQLLPGFCEDCWVTTSRALLGLPGGDDGLGYDFSYLDLEGRLSGRPGAECLIEVKSNAGELRARFSLSTHEWELAEACHGSEERVYIILRVHGVASSPMIGALLLDPVGLVDDGLLAISPKDGWWAELLGET